jgi:hypothetical protein
MSRLLGATFGKGISRFSITSGPPFLEIAMAWIVDGSDILDVVVENWCARVRSRRVNGNMHLKDNQFLRLWVDKSYLQRKLVSCDIS